MSRPAKNRRYTKAEKATAVIAAELSTVAAAAEQQGIPESTLHYWVDSPEFAELRIKTREEHAEGFRVIGLLAMAQLRKLIPEMEPRDLTILLGVAAEKAQLLSGGPTARTETRSLGDDLSDDEKQRLREWVDSLPATAGVPEGAAG